MRITVFEHPSRRSDSLLILPLLAVLLTLPETLPGAPITWGPATDIVNDSDVINTGSLHYSYGWGQTSSTLNGVSFTVASGINGGSNVLASAFSYDNQYDFTSTSAPFAALSDEYRSILVGADWAYGQVQVTLANLAVGHNYAVQVWVNDPRGQENSRSETISSPGGNIITLHFSTNTLSNPGGPGQYTVGTFKADATNQTFTLIGDPVNNVSQMNALQVRDIGPGWSGIYPSGSGAVKLIFTGPSGDHYTILTTTNIGDPIANWIPLPNGTGTFTGITMTNIDLTTANTAQFYRIRSP